MKTPHKHAEVIKAWAEGARIEVFAAFNNTWNPTVNPLWDCGLKYRVRPEAVLSLEASTLVSQLIQATKVAMSNHNTTRANACLNTRDGITAQLQHYILTLEQVALHPKTD